jgi:hypothetical protein
MNKIVVIALELGNWLKKFFNTLLSLVKVVLLTRKPSILPKVQKKQCSILGNGPSLRETLAQDIAFLEQTELVCVNNFAASEYFFKLKPQNYVLHDPAYYLYDGVTFKRADIEQTLLALQNNVDWSMNLYLQQRAKKSIFLQNLKQQNSNINLVYYNYTIFEGFDSIKHWFFKYNLAMPQAQNVMVVSLFLMVNRTFEQIFLFGADHSWHENFKVSEDGLTFKDQHFYDKKQVGYVKIYDVEKKENATMSTQFLSLSKAFRGYDVLKKYAQFQKIKVLNASIKTYVDAFPIVKINHE